MKKTVLLSRILCLLAAAMALHAATTGSISGTILDPSGAVVPGVMLTVTNQGTGIQESTMTDGKGFYSFPSLPVGRYDLKIMASGFHPLERKGIVVDATNVLQVDMTMSMAEKQQELTVAESAGEVQLESVSTQMGEVVSGSKMTAVALNGRSYTDLLALQPGIVPISTQTPDSIVMAGASVAIQPSGGLNPGNQSISGQREDANGFVVNGGDVKELMNGGTSIVPNLDSIAEFRVLTNNFDAEYGNYSGGIVNVITKSGDNKLHGSAFEFLRNTLLDARNFFSPDRSFYRQNQFGGTVGGPIRKNQVFFFGDYQGTRTNQGIDTGLIAVPTLAERSGDMSGIASQLTGTVNGPYLVNLLTQKLGYGVSTSEPYYTPGCATNLQCVFPNAIIPQSAWSAPAQHLLQYVPLPNTGSGDFSSGADGQKTRDDKGSFRVDGNSNRAGMLTGYYFFDDYTVNNPFPTGQGGASVPGFDALNLGRAQLVNFGDTKTFGATAVNEFHLSYMRNSNNVGQPSGGVGPSLASQGFVTGVGTPGIVPLDPSIEGVENVIFNSFTMGLPITNLKQANNTFTANDNFSKILGGHSLKAGLEASYEQVNVNPNATFNGSFLFNGTQTGSDFADFLIGVASNYNQADSQSYYIRHKYVGGFAQDSWRLRSNLNFNYGLRWDHMSYWSEKYNQIPTLIPGEQSKVYPNALPGLVYPTDPGVPGTLVPSSNRFSPRVGIAWTPGNSKGLLGKIIGGPGKTSIRAGYGIFYSVIEGNTMAIDEPQPPYGLSYTSPGPPLFTTPFITASNGQFLGNPFPLNFPPLNASINHPNPNVSFTQFIPQAGMTAPIPSNTYPYNENYFLSIERQLNESTLFSMSYAGSQAHHLLVVYSANPGNPALCLALSQPSTVAPGSPTCGPFGEDTKYITAASQTIQGTRVGLGPDFANDDYDATIGNSNFNSFQTSLRHSGKRLNVSIGYTFSKSIDQASSISDPVNPYNFAATRALSAFDLRHDFVASYEYQLPFDRLTSHKKWLTQGWVISGITRATSGFPVTLRVDGDNSLMGSVPNGVNNRSLDLPDYNGQALSLNSNPRNGLVYFNTDAFAPNAIGTAGDASRRSFSGPGELNFDLALLRNFKFSETRALQFRLESFNTFNHAQFFGPASVNGDISSALFGQVVKAQPPRLLQLALKYTF
ncbi:MAG TPA: carboxypeptidase regulatory-like domain-containing protein [Bryobacteraceae bacterium]|nr:carboxypeptidase regulatory-like domain-containing protein [Bryobacteraceae bacterium]